MKSVEAGAAWLDEVEPGWYERIDTDRLDLSSSCGCVLGQLYLDEHPRTRNKEDAYERKAWELGINPFDADAGRRGFIEYANSRFHNLTDAWVRAIARRRAA